VEGNPVLSERGVIGRIVGVSDHVSRILMLTDIESRTPVLIVRTNGRAILTGDGGPSPKLDYPRGAAMRVGDRVLTSGDGGVFPSGLPVGTVVKDYQGDWRVALDSDSSPIDDVQILLFKDFSQLVNEAALAPRTLPTAMTEEQRQSILGPGATPAARPGTPATAARPGTPAAAATPARAAQARPAGAPSQAAATTTRPGAPPARVATPAARPAGQPAAAAASGHPVATAHPAPAHAATPAATHPAAQAATPGATPAAGAAASTGAHPAAQAKPKPKPHPTPHPHPAPSPAPAEGTPY